MLSHSLNRKLSRRDKLQENLGYQWVIAQMQILNHTVLAKQGSNRIHDDDDDDDNFYLII